MYSAPIMIDLTVKGTKEIVFPACNRLWLAKRLIIGSQTIQANPTDAILGIQVGGRESAMQPWSIADGYVTSHSGKVDRIFVTVLQQGAENVLYLSTGTDVGVGYGNTDGLSPTVYSGSDAGDALGSRSRSGASAGFGGYGS